MIYRMLLIMLMLSPLILKAQTCEECKALDESYTYRYCNPSTGGYEVNCSKNPIGPGLIPWKLCLPAKIDYDNKGLVDKRAYAWSNNNGATRYTMFDEEEIAPIASDEQVQWELICGTYGPPRDDNCQKCDIKIRWSSDKADFGTGVNSGAATHTGGKKATSPTGGTCKADCDVTYILLNNTPEFMQMDNATGYPKNFFYTSTQPPIFNAFYQMRGYNYIDMRLLLLHEIGHLLGFDHTDKNCTKKSDGGTGGFGIMSLDPTKRSTTFTTYDKCMFKLLYCCDEQANEVVEPPTINSTFNIFPNPISSGVTIALSPSTAQYGKHLRVIDMGGKIVLEQQFQAGSSDCTVSTVGFSAGSYLFIMTFDGINGSFAQKVIVQ